jgi:hypothetical protein
MKNLGFLGAGASCIPALALLLSGCGDDGAATDDSDGSTGGSSSTTTTTTTTTSTTTDTTTIGTSTTTSTTDTDGTGGGEPVCGDGIVEGDEQCDEAGEANGCDDDCTFAECGDGTINNAAGETCDDSGRSDMCNADCTAVSCGDGILNLTAGEVCDGDGAGNVGETATCDADCTPAECGDGIVNATAGEACDGDGMGVGGETAACNADCTTSTCGDGIVNATAGETCDDGDANGDTFPCNASCLVGGGLDGTFGTTWETMAAGTNGSLFDLDSFHYSGSTYIYDWNSEERYDVAMDTWSAIPVTTPFGDIWANAATQPGYRWVPRNSSMWRYDTAMDMWEEVTAGGIPDGATQLSAAVFDGEGYVWYHGPNDDLVRYDPITGITLTIAHPDYGDMFETRMAYDPTGNILLFTGFGNDTFGLFDLNDLTFSQSSASPGGSVLDITCGDRSGHVYHGSGDDDTAMYQYDVATDTYAGLPTLIWTNDNNSTCTVSETGYLYVANSPSQMYRLPLGTQ